MSENLSVNNKMADYRKNFYKVYHSNIVPIFREFEKERKKSLAILALYMVLCAVLAGITGLCSVQCDSTFWALVCFILTVLTILLPAIFNYKFIGALKNNCMPKILPLFGSLKWYQGIDLIDDRELDNSGLFSGFNRRSTDDSFQGSYDGVKFMISETDLKYESGSGKNRSVETIFKGVVIQDIPLHSDTFSPSSL